MLRKEKEQGFTLIELMIVVAIIGILAAIAIPQFAAYRAKAFNSSAQADLRNMMTAEEAYYASETEYFSVASTTGASRNTTLGYAVGDNVTIVVTGTASDYNARAWHSSGDKSYKVTGSVGVIYSP